jgi:adenylate cyclase
VNTAARLESHGLSGRIQVSDAAHALLHKDFELEERGVVAIKDKGRMRTWFLMGSKAALSVRGVPFFF